MAFLSNDGLRTLLGLIKNRLDTKVDKEDGKCLSTNDFTDELKERLEDSSIHISAEDREKLDGISENATAVSFEQTQATGTEIGTLTINDRSHVLYAPAGGNNTSVSFVQTQTEGTEIGTLTINDTPHILYAPTVEGSGNSSVDMSDYLPITGGEMTGELAVPELRVTDGRVIVCSAAADDSAARVDLNAYWNEGRNAPVLELRGDISHSTDSDLRMPVVLGNVETPVAANDAVNKQYVDNNFVPTTGGVDLDLADHTLSAAEVVTPSIRITTADFSAGAKIIPAACETVDESACAVLYLEGENGDESTRLRNVAKPRLYNDAVNKEYVDNNFIPVSGGAIAGALKMGGADIENAGIISSDFFVTYSSVSMASAVDKDGIATRAIVLDASNNTTIANTIDLNMSTVGDGEQPKLHLNLSGNPGSFITADEVHADTLYATSSVEADELLVQEAEIYGDLSVHGNILVNSDDSHIECPRIDCSMLHVTDTFRLEGAGLAGTAVCLKNGTTGTDDFPVLTIEDGAGGNAVLRGLLTPVHNSDAASKEYVDSKIANLPTGGGELTRKEYYYASGQVFTYTSKTNLPKIFTVTLGHTDTDYCASFTVDWRAISDCLSTTYLNSGYNNNTRYDYKLTASLNDDGTITFSTGAPSYIKHICGYI